jgi:hypothetical protein
MTWDFGGFGQEPPVAEPGLVGEDVGTRSPSWRSALGYGRCHGGDCGGGRADGLRGGFGPLPNSVWYRLTPAEGGPYEFSTAESSYSTAVGIYTGSRGLLTQVSCFSEGAGLIAEAGVTYYIRVADYFGQGGGSLVFSARRRVTVDDLTIDGTGLLDRASGSVTVSGSVTCSEPATVVLSLGIEQRHAQGAAEAEVPCSQTPSTWSVLVLPLSGRFVPGPAQVSAQAGLCSELVCDIEKASASIRVRA